MSGTVNVRGRHVLWTVDVGREITLMKDAIRISGRRGRRQKALKGVATEQDHIRGGLALAIMLRAGQTQVPFVVADYILVILLPAVAFSGTENAKVVTWDGWTVG